MSEIENASITPVVSEVEDTPAPEPTSNAEPVATDANAMFTELLAQMKNQQEELQKLKGQYKTAEEGRQEFTSQQASCVCVRSHTSGTSLQNKKVDW